MTRDEHLTLAKRRALQYLDRSDLKEAFTSMCSDLNKHDELKVVGERMFPLGLLYVTQRDAYALRRWIEGFR